MLWPILKMLLEIQEQKSKDIYEEEIANAIFALSNVDYPVFYSSFLPSFLKEKNINTEQYPTLTSKFMQIQVCHNRAINHMSCPTLYITSHLVFRTLFPTSHLIIVYIVVFHLNNSFK